ncbi:MAG: Txe/YoeB family addiction module toxin [Schwartzia sp.]|nr:Txe/YoeB family addiction module toxin [Schwartzia sp. (in: firmicutes)]
MFRPGLGCFSRLLLEDRKTTKRILQLIKDIKRNGYEGIGKPEPLSGDLSGYWSRRIDKKNRLVYKIDGDIVIISQCGSHYQNK